MATLYTTSGPRGPATQIGARWLDACNGWLRGAAAAWRAGQARPRLEDLDDATLRDLGIDRSEFGSVRAELDGQAELSRLRVGLHSGCGPVA